MENILNEIDKNFNFLNEYLISTTLNDKSKLIFTNFITNKIDI